MEQTWNALNSQAAECRARSLFEPRGWCYSWPPRREPYRGRAPAGGAGPWPRRACANREEAGLVGAQPGQRGSNMFPKRNGLLPECFGQVGHLVCSRAVSLIKVLLPPPLRRDGTESACQRTLDHRRRPVPRNPESGAGFGTRASGLGRPRPALLRLRDRHPLSAQNGARALMWKAHKGGEGSLLRTSNDFVTSGIGKPSHSLTRSR